MTQDKARTTANQQQLVADWEISPSSERHIQREWKKEKKQKFKLNYNAQEKTKGDSWQVRAQCLCLCACVCSPHSVDKAVGKKEGVWWTKTKSSWCTGCCVSRWRQTLKRQKVHSSDCVCVTVSQTDQISTVSQWRVKLEKVQIQRPSEREKWEKRKRNERAKLNGAPM